VENLCQGNFPPYENLTALSPYTILKKICNEVETLAQTPNHEAVLIPASIKGVATDNIIHLSCSECITAWEDANRIRTETLYVVRNLIHTLKRYREIEELISDLQAEVADGSHLERRSAIERAIAAFRENHSGIPESISTYVRDPLFREWAEMDSEICRLADELMSEPGTPAQRQISGGREALIPEIVNMEWDICRFLSSASRGIHAGWGRLADIGDVPGAKAFEGLTQILSDFSRCSFRISFRNLANYSREPAEHDRA